MVQLLPILCSTCIHLYQTHGIPWDSGLLDFQTNRDLRSERLEISPWFFGPQSCRCCLFLGVLSQEAAAVHKWVDLSKLSDMSCDARRVGGRVTTAPRILSASVVPTMPRQGKPWINLVPTKTHVPQKKPISQSTNQMNHSKYFG